MPVKVYCPNPSCRRKLRAPDSLAGKTVRCPMCSASVQIPLPARTVAPDPLIGAHFGHFRITSKLSEAGTGALYRAINTQTNQPVLLKLLPQSRTERQPFLARELLQQAVDVGKPGNPNVVPVLSTGNIEGRYFIEMELIEGNTLQQLLDSDTPPDAFRVAEIIMQAARGLAEAHHRNVVHGNVKPDNILIPPQGGARITDFALVNVSESDAELTGSGQLMGTPHYMAPEIAEGEDPNERSDIYSLGATFFHALTGRPPYDGKALLDILKKHKSERVPKPSDYNPKVPASLCRIVQKMMAKRPRTRYQNCEELIADLEQALTPKEVSAPVPEKSPKRRAVIAAVAGVLVLFLVIAGVMLSRASRKEERKEDQVKLPLPAQLHSHVAERQKQLAKADSTPVVPEKPQAPQKKPEQQEKTPPARTTQAPPKPLPVQKKVAAVTPPKPPPSPAEKEPPAPEADPARYAEAVKPIDALIDQAGYDEALKLLEPLIKEFGVVAQRKKDNITRLKKARAQVFKAVNSGTIVVSMRDVSRSLGFAGNMVALDEEGIVAAEGKFKKKWNAISKEEIYHLYKNVLGTKGAEPNITLAVFLTEGTPSADLLDTAVSHLDAAKAAEANTTPYLQQIDFLRTVVAMEPRPAAEEAPEAEQVGEAEFVSIDGKKVRIPDGMVYVSAGEFIMGDEAINDARPDHTVHLSGFVLDKYEVTNAEYRKFVDATGHLAPPHWKDGQIPEGREQHPVVNVSWQDAAAYARWAGKRLPTEAEWEKAAVWDPVANTKRTFPWGDKFDPKKCNSIYTLGYSEGPKGQEWLRAWQQSPQTKELLDNGGATVPVGTIAAGVSPYGCYDMAGNAYEWCADWYDSNYYKVSPTEDPKGPAEGGARVLKGGSWFSQKFWLQGAARNSWDPAKKNETRGFRCAMSLDDLTVKEKTSPPDEEVTAKRKEKKPSVPEDMVLIPAGEFTMGDDSLDGAGPLHRVYLDPYLIDKHEVTNAQFKEFLDATNYTPQSRGGFLKYWQNGSPPTGKENHPVVYVSWRDAVAYSQWAGKRLPTEAEWEKAASWSPIRRNKSIYPWGDKFGPEKCNSAYRIGFRANDAWSQWWENWCATEKGKRILDSGGATTPVGSFKEGASKYGCDDMAGNAAEWCADWYDENYYGKSSQKDPQGPTDGSRKALRGGSWQSYVSTLKSASRSSASPNTRSYSIGFRCVKDVPPDFER